MHRLARREHLNGIQRQRPNDKTHNASCELPCGLQSVTIHNTNSHSRASRRVLHLETPYASEICARGPTLSTRLQRGIRWSPSYRDSQNLAPDLGDRLGAEALATRRPPDDLGGLLLRLPACAVANLALALLVDLPGRLDPLADQREIFQLLDEAGNRISVQPALVDGGRPGTAAARVSPFGRGGSLPDQRPIVYDPVLRDVSVRCRRPRFSAVPTIVSYRWRAALSVSRRVELTSPVWRGSPRASLYPQSG